MSSKLVILLALFCLIDLSAFAIRTNPLAESKLLRKPSRTGKFAKKPTQKKPLKTPVELPSIDTSSYHRLVNARLGPNFALDVSQVKNGYYPQLNTVNGKYSQEWRFVELDDGAYLIENRFLGEGYALDLIIDGEKARVLMNRRANKPGQRWHFVPVEHGSYKLYNEFSSDGIFLDCFIDDRFAYTSISGPNEIGQYWSFEDVGPNETY